MTMPEEKILSDIKKILEVQQQQVKTLNTSFTQLESKMIKLETNHLPHIFDELKRISKGQGTLARDLEILTQWVKEHKH